MRAHAAVLSLLLALLALAAPALAFPYASYGTPVVRDASHVRAHPSPSPSPSPSPKPHHGKGPFVREPRIPTRRAVQARAQNEQEPVMSPSEASLQLCPDPLSVCPIVVSAPSRLSEWLRDGFECVDTREDLMSCGGCGVLDKTCVAVPSRSR